jgi:hypothetical protein
LIVREDVFGKPGGEGLAVPDGRLPESEELANLVPVVLDCTDIPMLMSPFPGRDFDLAGDVLYDDAGDIPPLLGETSLTLVELERDGKAQARRPALVGEKPLLAGQQGPVLGQFVGIPVLFHTASSSPGRSTCRSSLYGDRAVARDRSAVYSFPESGKAKLSWPSGGRRVTKHAGKRPDFVGPSKKAKSHVVGQIVRLARNERLDNAEFLLKANPKKRDLFESRPCSLFASRRVQQIVQGYRDRTGIARHVHPHLFRHQMPTFVTAQLLSDAQIQLISGHESRRSLEDYQHLSLETVEEAHQENMKSVDV